MLVANFECLVGTDSPPMHSRRPAWLESELDTRFNTLQAGPPKGYSFNGEPPDYEFEDLGCSANGLVNKLEQERNRSLRILDIGAAAGGFVLNCLQAGHEAQALSAHDYRELSRFNTLTNQLPRSAYVLGDANRLSELTELEGDYDLIVSRSTFFHLADTVGTLEQAANMLAPGGIIVATGVDIEASLFYHDRAMSAVTPTLLIAGLVRAGFKTSDSSYTSSHGRNRFATFAAQRQSEAADVRFAAGYSGRPDQWRYVIWGDRRLPEIENVA
jgi:2-polyprenyl-3-methyl-5-hydroxy-6-metoxy-1,4-benzoquinol methylase